MKRRTLWILLGLAMALSLALLLLTGDDAWARVGGGQNFSSGGGGGGGFSSSGGGSSGGELEILFLLIHLAIEVPIIGVPLLILFVGFIIFRVISANRRPRFHSKGSHYGSGQRSEAAPVTPRGSIRGLDALKTRDGGFSMPVLLDYLQLVHRRGTSAAVQNKWQALTPFIAPGARKALTDGARGLKSVSGIVLGAMELREVEVGPRWTRLRVLYKSVRVEDRGQGPSQVYMEEVWTFRRASTAASLPPEETSRMGCPSCGSAVDTDEMGACRACGTPITKGQLQWQAEEIRVAVPRRAAPPPDVSKSAGGIEPGARMPTVYAPDLNPQLRGLVGRHPDFKLPAFRDRVEGIYFAIQEAWSDNQWGKARPFVTDNLFHTLGFYLLGYEREGLRNALENIKLGKVEIVKVEVDAWYESITVRLWGSMRDFVVDKQGQVVGGNMSNDRGFSEYWTFIRATGTGGAAKDTVHCPSCGAPLDQVNQAGVCGYCDTRITTGRFDWVLSRIDQPEVYRG